MTPGSKIDPEKRAWELLTRDFHWEVPSQHPVQIYDTSGNPARSTRLQIFEMAVTTILAHLAPQFTWRVTPNVKDDGLDFIGVHRLLEDGDLGIAATITIGGQCKKRTRVDDVLAEIAGSLIRMADAVNPTFFVVALSARLTRERVARARGMLERQCLRDCHILDRTQIEGLFSAYLDVVREILERGLSQSELEEVVRYLETEAVTPRPSVAVNPPSRVLAGAPFHVEVGVRWVLASNSKARLRWHPPDDDDVITLIGPVDADTSAGAALISEAPAQDPLRASCSLELTTYSTGRIDLGSIAIDKEGSRPGSAERFPLGDVDVIRTLRPRFFEPPYKRLLHRLSQAYKEASSGLVASMGVVGSGGSGKSRMCEEFALERQRRGSIVVTAKQTKTYEAPHRILAELMTGLCNADRAIGDAATEVVRAVASYDPPLATRAEPAIRAAFGVDGSESGAGADQSVISALLVLIVARIRNATLIVHLQDMHWCNADVLLLLERLVAQVSQITRTGLPNEDLAGGVLFLFEGRVHESESDQDGWSSVPFEAFLLRTESPVVTCTPFTEEDGRTFVRVLFEDRHNTDRLLADDLLGLQDELVDHIYEVAGGNPFHTLEQVRILMELGVVGQNPRTGLLYMIRSIPGDYGMPESVFAAIRLRWQYLRRRSRRLALLVWGCALIEDQVPTPLFRHLWGELASDVSLPEVDSTDILWTGGGRGRDVSFRHENYFETLRNFTVSYTDRRTVVGAYCDWFEALRRPSPADRFRWAQAILKHPEPDLTRARRLLSAALKGSRRSGDLRLARRILAFHLDLSWDLDEQDPVRTETFLRHCDDEIDLCHQLLATDRDQAGRRAQRARERLQARLEAARPGVTENTLDKLRLRTLALDTLHAQVLFNNRRPATSAAVATHVVDQVRAQRSHARGDASWEELEMEALFTQSCAQAISGDFPSAVRSSEAAADIARRSSSPAARSVLSTHGSILLSEDPVAGEVVLRGCIERWPDDETSDGFLVHVHLSMALVLQAHRLPNEDDRRTTLLDDARERLDRVFNSCRRLGLHPDAGAAALVRGVVSVVAERGDEAYWFAQGVAAAAKGRQMETLWRSHLNLATALYRRDYKVTQIAHDHALEAAKIMEDSLSPYAEPDRSPRFELLRVGLAAAASMLIVSGDAAGTVLLERYPRLRAHFSDASAGVLAPYEGGERHYQWLRVGEGDYVLY